MQWVAWISFAALTVMTACEGRASRSLSEAGVEARDGGAIDDASVALDSSAQSDGGSRDAAVGPATSDSGARDASTPTPNAHCAPAASWDAAYTAFEERALELVNKARAAGRSCGGANFAATHPLVMEPRLRCAARLHSKYMGETKDYGHVTRDGVSYEMRISDAGYKGLVSENIAAGARSAEEVMDLWLTSTGHCRNIMDPQFTQIGIGYATDNADDPYFGPYPYWTQTFGRP